MKVENREIYINVKDKKGKIKNSKKITNLLTNLFLNYLVDKATGIQIGTDDPMANLYIKFNEDQTPPITEESTTMDFDIKLVNTVEYSEQLSGSNYFSSQNFYQIEIGSGNDGDQLYSLGFGKDEEWFDDYLYAFVDVSSLDITVYEDDVLEIVRIDDYFTDGTIIPGATDFGKQPFHLGFFPTFGFGVFYWTILKEIGYSYYDDGSNIYKRYPITEMDIEYNEFGEAISIDTIINTPYNYIDNNTGVEFDLDNFRVSEELSDYPQDDYPQDDYPAPVNPSFRSKIFEYEVWVYGTFGEVFLYDTYRYIKKLEEQETTVDDTEMKERIKIERGGL